METTEKKAVEVRENPITLNYAVNCAVFNLDEEEPEILLVKYNEDPNRDNVDPQIRLPGGKFRAKDLIEAIDYFFEESGYNQSLAFAYDEINRLDERFSPFIKKAKNRSEANFLFDELTEKLLSRFQSCRLSEENFKKILMQTHLNTAIHELQEETFAERIGNLHLAHWHNDLSHHKMTFVSCDVKAPISSSGSGDRKIVKAYWSPIGKNTIDLLFNGHKDFFQAGIREAIKLKLHPNVGVLEKFLTAIN